MTKQVIKYVYAIDRQIDRYVGGWMDYNLFIPVHLTVLTNFDYLWLSFINCNEISSLCN